MTELLDLPFLLKKALPLANRKRRYSSKTILRRLELVKIWNTPNYQLLNYACIGKILKVSGETVKRDCVFLANRNLLSPFRNKDIPFSSTESFQEFIKRFLEVHGIET
jgi:hypothetical protein